MPVSIGDSPEKRLTILVSDDDHGVRRSLQLLLRSQGYQVRAFTSGSALLADPHSACADCLIVDYRMPDIDGLEVLRNLKRKGWCGTAIMISAYRSEQLETRARQAGFEEVLAKPLIARAVLKAMEKHLNKGQGE